MQCEPALDQQAHAAADQVARFVETHRLQPFPREQDVEGVDEIGGGVDEGAVEVEDDRQRGHARRGYRDALRMASAAGSASG